MIPPAGPLLLMLLALGGILPIGIAVVWLGVIGWRRFAKLSEIERDVTAIMTEVSAIREDVHALREQQADVMLMLDEATRSTLDAPAGATVDQEHRSD